MSDYSKLKELAEAASEGSWVQDAFEVVSDGIEDRRVARCSWLTDAQYIAAANPVVVLGLIAENERLKKFEDWFSRLETATTAIDESFRDERDLALFSVFWAARLFMVPTEVIESGDEDYCEKLIRSGAETLMVGGRRLRDAAEKDEKGKPVIPFDWQYRSARELAQ